MRDKKEQTGGSCRHLGRSKYSYLNYFKKQKERWAFVTTLKTFLKHAYSIREGLALSPASANDGPRTQALSSRYLASPCLSPGCWSHLRKQFSVCLFAFQIINKAFLKSRKQANINYFVLCESKFI